jgi:hypothetical protein
MNGAAAGDSDARTMKAERITSTMSIGANQNFFLTFIKSQNSFINDMAVSSLNLFHWPN